MIMNRIYAKQCLVNSGIDFNTIPKKNILMTCKRYNGIIGKDNYAAILDALNEIYREKELIKTNV